MHGGVKFYRGSAAAARAYVEADHSRADDYYLAEGSGVATRYTAAPDAQPARVGEMDGESYERWVAGYDVDTGAAKGRLRDDGNALRFVEVTVNGPKTWSLAAALHPEVSATLDAAQDRAAEQIISWLAEHATTRVGPRGRQVQVPVESIEAAVIRHYTSRAGDPHRHLHLQVNARVFAEGKWRGLHSVGVRDMVAAINGIGHAAVATDPEFRAVLATHGLTMNPATGELSELTPYVGRFSARTAQIGRNVDRYEAEWRADHPGEEPGPRLRRSWDRRAGRKRAPRSAGPLPPVPMKRPKSPLMGPGWCQRGTACCTNWATATRSRSACRSHPPGPRSGHWTATLRRSWSSPGSGQPGRHGMARTSAAGWRSGSPPPDWLPRRVCGSSWPRTPQPAPSTSACRYSTGRACPSTSAP